MRKAGLDGMCMEDGELVERGLWGRTKGGGVYVLIGCDLRRVVEDCENGRAGFWVSGCCVCGDCVGLQARACRRGHCRDGSHTRGVCTLRARKHADKCGVHTRDET